MKRALFLLGLCAALLLPAGAWTDVVPPGLSGEQLQRHYEQRRLNYEARMRAQNRPAGGKLADILVWAITGGIQLKFRLAGPGECEYTLRGPKSGDDLGSVAAQGRHAAEENFGYVLEEKVLFMPAPEEGVAHRYHVEALCRVTPVEQTSFGPKETGQAEEVRLTHTFNLRRESVYRVTPVRQ